MATCGFIQYDDPLYVTDNYHVLKGLTWENVRWALGSMHDGNWIPLVWLSYELDVTLFGLDPAGYHVHNLILHVANTILLFWTFTYMTQEKWPSAAVALLFAIHPLHVESVAWIAERKDVLSTLFWIVTLLAYAHYARQPSFGRYVAVVVAFALGLVSKSMLVTVPCVLLLLDFWPLRRFSLTANHGQTQTSTAGERRYAGASILRLIAEKMPLLALSAVCSMLTVIAQSKIGAVASVENTTWKNRLMNVGEGYATYLWRTVYPLDLTCFYPIRLGHQSLSAAIVGAAVITLLTLLIVSRTRHQPYLVVGWFWFLGTLVPVIGLVQVGAQSTADRYTYVPLIGIFMALAWGMADLIRLRRLSSRLTLILCTAATLSLGACTWNQVGYWHDDVTLWRHAVEVTGPNRESFANLGQALMSAGKVEEALPYLVELTKRSPSLAWGHNNLGLAYLYLGRYDESLAAIKTALRLDPEDAVTHHSYGRLLAAQGDLPEAKAEFEKALEINPNSWRSHMELADLLERQGAHDEA
ncbi:MAG TPA: tetratricopeptide repeat protein, partial [Gemmataceae bacterium]|nr:tetratricopeptide repeat protein [Gemmataceae bacterium]